MNTIWFNKFLTSLSPRSYTFISHYKLHNTTALLNRFIVCTVRLSPHHPALRAPLFPTPCVERGSGPGEKGVLSSTRSTFFTRFTIFNYRNSTLCSRSAGRQMKSDRMTPSEPIIDVAVVGGGASGMMAAISAQKVFSAHGKSAAAITVFERNDRVGKKLLATGNGRCNLTNLDCTPSHFHGETTSFLEQILREFTPGKICSLFEELGLSWTAEESKVFPASLHATSVLDTLRLYLDEHTITAATGIRISTVSYDKGLFFLKTGDGSVRRARTVIVATGGKCAPSTGSDGAGYAFLQSFSHELVTPAPSIVQLVTETKFVRPLSGNKIRGSATLFIDGAPVRSENGELLFTDYGLSGPPVLQLSGHVARALRDAPADKKPVITVTLDFCPLFTKKVLVEQLQRRRASFGTRRLEEFFTGFFQRRLACGILKASTAKPLSAPVSELTDEDLASVIRSCKELSIAVTGTQSFAQAQTTAGGIALGGFNTATLESLHRPGLFACGEVLDIDGDCGGYNLHWAWTSGWIAGESAARHVLQEHA